MKVLMIGGTGLLGSAAAQIFVDRGNEIKTLALPPLPEGRSASQGDGDRFSGCQ